MNLRIARKMAKSDRYLRYNRAQHEESSRRMLKAYRAAVRFFKWAKTWTLTVKVV